MQPLKQDVAAESTYQYLFLDCIPTSSETRPNLDKNKRFNNDISKKTYSSTATTLYITTKSDSDMFIDPFISTEIELIKIIKKFIRNDKIEKARSILELAKQLYPANRTIQKFYNLIKTSQSQLIGHIPNISLSDEYNWLTKYSNEYRGQWVGLKGKELIFAHQYVSKVIEKINEKNLSNFASIHFIPQ